MPSINLHQSYGINQNQETISNLLTKVEQNQKSGIYTRDTNDNAAYNLTTGHPTDFATQSVSWLNEWNQLHDEQQRQRNQSAIRSRSVENYRRSPSTFSRVSVSNRRSPSPNRAVSIQFNRQTSERPVDLDIHSGHRHFYHPQHQNFELRQHHPYHRYYFATGRFLPLTDRYFLTDEARRSSAKEVERKVLESHRDLAKLKTLIRDTFGSGYEDDYCAYRKSSSAIDLSVTEDSNSLKMDPEILLDTIERRRRRSSLPVNYYAHPFYKPSAVSQSITSTAYKNLESTLPSHSRSSEADHNMHRPLRLSVNAAHSKPLSLFRDHLDYVPSRSIDMYLFEPKRIIRDFQLYSPVSHALPVHISYPRTYNYQSSINSPRSVLPSLDLALPGRYSFGPEATYMTIDRSKDNKLVRSRVHMRRAGPEVRSHHVAPYQRSTSVGVYSLPHTHIYRAPITQTPTPILSRQSYISHYDTDLGYPKLEDTFKSSEKHIDLYRHQPYISHETHRYRNVYDSDDDAMSGTSHSYNFRTPVHHRYHYPPRYYSTAFSPLAVPRHACRTSVSPMTITESSHRYPLIQHHHPDDKGDWNSALVRTKPLITVEKVFDELDDKNDADQYDAQTHFLRPRHDYGYYRQTYRSRAASHTPENLSHEQQTENVHHHLQEDGHYLMPSNNTIYQDGYYYGGAESQSNIDGVILTPPTKITKPGTYVQRSSSGEIFGFVSQQDFDPHLHYQRYSVY